ncbi:ABC transporter substrate-binding protein [Candidatus Contubernalis alkaliaceticus]|uniref:ABC transporter substrate-binding protein n=1 Tax=Candidatus Contubernalis alkaliaceticus TaxID=338645 RepID=UPI001F4C2D6C|nr:ABC transporter substrate-binding protein [Candidatus Contubernalis alkalaceticus]UNC92504.1 ABC transporter substrate-binding protein [Candidatus Contubernalis alkalaceticus]
MFNKLWFKTAFVVILGIFVLGSCFGCAAEGEDPVTDDKDIVTEEKENQEALTFPITIIDMAGNEVVIEKEPETIVSLRPSATETLFALGLGDKVIGVTEFCYYPEEAKGKEKVGDFIVNVEKVVSLDPDIIFTFEHYDEAVDTLREQGYAVIDLDSKTLDEVLHSFELVGKITNTSDKAEDLIAEISADIDEIKEFTSNLENDAKPKVFVMLDTESLYSVGSDTYLNNLIETAGGINIAADVGAGWPVLSEEKIFEDDPDVIICTHPMKEIVMARDNWQDLKAVQNEQVYDADGDLVSRPGPRVALGLKHILDIIHPNR